jgi:diguanylate cyclase (GGDEF)-like protein
MTATDHTGIRPPPFDFAHYAHLLRSLMPRARVISLYGAGGELRWATDGVERPELRPFVEDVIDAGEALQGLDPEGRVALVEDEPGCFFRLVADSGELVGVLALLCPATAYSAAPPDFQRVRQQLAPLLELLRRDLAARMVPAHANGDATLTQELEFLLGTARFSQLTQVDPLQHYIDGYRERTGCTGVLLLIPDWRIERWSGIGMGDVAVPALRKLAATSLWKLTQTAPQIRTLDPRPSDTSGNTLPYRYLCGPLGHGSRTVGLVLAFQGLNGRGFSGRDVDRLRRFLPRLQETLEWRFDARTGLLQRAAFELEVTARRERRSEGHCIVAANLDRLHVLNDLYGFAYGDQLIREVGTLWRTLCTDAKAPATRIAGDRFAALLPTGDVGRARAFAEMLRTKVAVLKVPAGPELGNREGVSLSLGIARLEPDIPFEHTLAAAEASCQAAKDGGRNRVEVYDEAHGHGAATRDAMKQFKELRSALESGRFELYVQPIVPLWDRSRAVEYEILPRLHDANGRIVAPIEFLDTAARYQLLAQLDRWVMTETLKMLGPRAAGTAAGGVRFALNVSGMSLADGSYADELFAALDATGLAGGWLSIDIPEPAATADLEATSRFVERMDARGISVSLDDFGGGRSALAHLKALKVRRLKIDGTFIQDVTTNANSEGLVRAVVQIGRQLGLETAGECVSEESVSRHLAALGVDFGQGSHLGAPRPLLTFLREVTAPAAAARIGA